MPKVKKPKRTNRKQFWACRGGVGPGIYYLQGRESAGEWKPCCSKSDALTWIQKTNPMYTSNRLRHWDDDRFVHVYTDGGCVGNGTDKARAGCGIYWGENNPRNHRVPLDGPKQTNQRAELMAALLAVRQYHNISTQLPLKIHTDSRYTIMGVTEWYPNWIRTQRSPSTIDNFDLFRELYEAVHACKAPKTVHFHKVPGHRGIIGNIEADALAKQATHAPNFTPNSVLP